MLGSINRYDEVLGLKTDVDFVQKAPSSNTWVSYARQQYAYDPRLDYLTSAKYDDDCNGSWDATHTWSYDAAGNRATASAQPGTWSYDNLNRMTASPMGVYENDLLGNRIWQNRYVQNAIARKMEWDVLNRMTSACTQSAGARYEYRADGIRTLKVEGLSLVWQNLSEEEQEEEGSGFYDSVWATNKPTTRYFYDGQMPIEDDFTRLVNNQMTVDVTRNGLGARGIDIIEKTTSGGTTTVFPVYDGHGNMVATLSRAGTGFAVNDRRSFDAWGIVRAGATSGDPKGRYCANLGHVQDDESGLVYMRARYYEASSGRFVSEDPARHGLNWFRYCTNDPIQRVDSSGRFDWITLGTTAFVETMLAGLFINSMVCHTAATVAIYGLLMLAAWFSDKYFVGDPNSRPIMGLGLYLTLHTMAVDLLALSMSTAGLSDAQSGIAQKCEATVRNYFIIVAMFMYLEFMID